MRKTKLEAPVPSYDPLTGLYDRQTGSALTTIALYGGERGLFGILDCSNFKHINLQFGIFEGDKLIRRMADSLRKTLPPDSFAFRIAADEFAFHIKGAFNDDKPEFNAWVQRFFNALSACQISDLEKEMLDFNVGLYSYGNFCGLSYDQIYQLARTQNRRAKEFDGNYLCMGETGIPDITRAFQLLAASRKVYDDLNEKSFLIEDGPTWMEFVDKRADIKFEMCQRNSQLFEQILEFFKEERTPTDYDLLYNAVRRNHSLLDQFMVEQLVGNILLPYYEKKIWIDNDLRTKLAYLYLTLGDSYLGIAFMGDRSYAQKSSELFLNCERISAPLPRDSEGYMYHFYAICHGIGHPEEWKMGIRTVEHRDRLFEEFRALVSGPNAIVLKDPEIEHYYRYLVNNARNYPMIRVATLIMNEELSREEKAEMRVKLAYIKKHSPRGNYDLMGEQYSSQCLTKALLYVLLKKGTEREQISYVMTLLESIVDNPLNARTASGLTAASYMLFSLSSMVQHGDLPMNEKSKTTLHCWDLMLRLCRRRRYRALDHQSTNILCRLVELVLNSGIIDIETKLKYCSKTLGILMTDTYAHSRAVSAFASMITTEIINHYPSMLIGVNLGITSVEEVLKRKKSILNYVRWACVFHDIGKLRLTTVISNSFRNLTEHEKQMLTKHPELGCEFIEHDNYLKEFVPTVIGHHKWYDGTGGYPESYRMNRGFNRILVDIITLCDSLEAATSRIGRTYRSGKPFSQIMDEFYSQVGTRYNPEVFRVITSSADTYKRIKQMVDTNWKLIYQRIYDETTSETLSPDYSFLYQHEQEAAGADPLHDPKMTRARLMTAIESQNASMAVIKALASSFEAMFHFNLEDMTYSAIQVPHSIASAVQKLSRIDELAETYCEKLIKEEYRPAFRKFADFTTLGQRLLGQRFLSIEYETKNIGWAYCRAIPARVDSHGKILSVIFTVEDFAEKHREHEYLMHASQTDSMTGLMNRAAGEQHFRSHYADGTPIIGAIFDCDKFKQINDTLGHYVGDKVLRAISTAFRETFPEEDVMRMGGDEFCVCIYGKTLTDHFASGKHIDELFAPFYERVAAIDIPELDGRKVTVSGGAVVCRGNHKLPFDDQFRRCDEALYLTKRSRQGSITIIEGQ